MSFLDRRSRLFYRQPVPLALTVALPLLLLLPAAPEAAVLAGTPGYIIALRGANPWLVANTARLLLGAPPTVWAATNGTVALRTHLPLFTRATLATGRHDHMQIGSPAMLGCLLSHMAVWRHMLAANASQALVLEEDARIDELSATRLSQLLLDVGFFGSSAEAEGGAEWDILMLDAGHVTVVGATRRVGVLGLTWAAPTDPGNRWMGTRGYVLRAGGARLLLRRAVELTVQVDALLALTVVFDGLRMVWPSASIAHSTPWRPSAVQTYDPCLKCFVPASSPHALLAVACVLAVCAVFGRLVARRSAKSNASYAVPVAASSIC